MMSGNGNGARDSSGRSLGELAALLKERRLPPVHLWNPERCGDSEMRIAVDGTWFHQGSPIGRPALVQLFSTILRREPDGGYVLVTPHEKLDIAVEDAPFVAVEVVSEGQGSDRRLVFRLNTEDHVEAGPEHPLRVDVAEDGTPRPYLKVRDGLEALVARSVFYELADLALGEGGAPPGLWSGGAFFPFGDGH
ncbi:MAG: DUF1285 domain-containing protein [Polymorphobacter sp.]|uniref:DUF1285 domain-containing protein n=1 Tax=Polymorphobacter sp. TaxID=1909290 RepID=UPI003A8B0086